MVKNDGGGATTVSITVELLEGSTVAASRTLSLGELAASESASFALPFDVNPGRVDGRHITFE
jgi:hypothetical protein